MLASFHVKWLVIPIINMAIPKYKTAKDNQLTLLSVKTILAKTLSKRPVLTIRKFETQQIAAVQLLAQMGFEKIHCL
jgi:hypothetical protein